MRLACNHFLDHCLFTKPSWHIRSKWIWNKMAFFKVKKNVAQPWQQNFAKQGQADSRGGGCWATPSTLSTPRLWRTSARSHWGGCAALVSLRSKIPAQLPHSCNSQHKYRLGRDFTLSQKAALPTSTGKWSAVECHQGASDQYDLPLCDPHPV